MSHSDRKSVNPRQQRGKNYPDGYLEDWSRDSVISKSTVASKPTESSSQRSDTKKKERVIFTPVASILSTTINQILSMTNNYVISFGTGMVEGSGITINDEGDTLIFNNSGSYRFELSAEVVPYSNTRVSVHFDSSEFTKDIEVFSNIDLPEKQGKYKIKNISTLLPINSHQKLRVKIVSPSNESLILLSNARLLIYRVA